MEFGQKLRDLRRAAGYTQQQLAEKAGIATGTVRNYEQGIREPSWPGVVKLAKAIGISTDEFADCVVDERRPAKRKKRAVAQ